ncbi:MAG: DNA double-strand break repair nuclease NurA [Armatimonadota bacterium]|nr:DNA double-strand break repair nuclease NurA [Armatimonadota bacterium]MCX7778136.1 DNA double-strand break repair nuclease NurA [Armatimonadota bacterium]MDW8024848.1 DNA double-strand break repair nuclease NurA [Armatimonadota bacterium]
MLDFVQLKRQLDEMAVEQVARREDIISRSKKAFLVLKQWAKAWEEVLKKVEASKTSWLLANPTEVLDFKRFVSEPKRPLTVVASDGSQIFPDRHEVALCYLLNIGLVALHYGTGEPPLMRSHPLLYYREEDLYEHWGGRRVLINHDMASVKRQLLEIQMLADLACSLPKKHSRVCLVDGSLIFWRLEGMPEDFADSAVKNLLVAIESMRDEGIPVAGYISSPGSTDVVNALKLCICPYERANCDRCEYKRGSEMPPCSCIDGVTDALMFRHLLSKGEYTQPFGSSSKILERYGEHAIKFVYINVGYEVARVEVPSWVARDAELMDIVLSTVFEQAQKGNGYPVALAEAHERAVIRGSDRELFFRMLEEAFVKHNIRVSVSLKMLAKRAPAV